MGTLGIVETLIVVASIITAGTVIAVFANKIFKVLRKFVRFLDDFNGVEERPGQDHRPGFPERIKDLEECMREVGQKVNSLNDTSESIKKIENKVILIEKELHPNHGTSMRDAVDKIQLRLQLVEEKLESHVRSAD
jgi:hypothetical protein